jgi:hypothetical protein
VKHGEPTLPRTVWTQLDSRPAGGSGTNQLVYEPSSYGATGPLRLITLGFGLSVCGSGRVWCRRCRPTRIFAGGSVAGTGTCRPGRGRGRR